MKNNLQALNDYLFEQLERLNDDEISQDELDRELKKSEAITSIAHTIIESGNLALKVARNLDGMSCASAAHMPVLLNGNRNE